MTPEIIQSVSRIQLTLKPYMIPEIIQSVTRIQVHDSWNNSICDSHSGNFKSLHELGDSWNNSVFGTHSEKPKQETTKQMTPAVISPYQKSREKKSWSKSMENRWVNLKENPLVEDASEKHGKEYVLWNFQISFRTCWRHYN